MKIYRYMNRNRIDDFLADGSLLISTLERCRGFEGDVRQDVGEGTFTTTFLAEGTSLTKTFDQVQPIWTMVLCCSLFYRLDLQERFEVDGCIEILDATAFFEAVSEALPVKFSEKESGAVRYLATGRVESRSAEERNLRPYDFNRLVAEVQALRRAGMFNQETAAELARAANGFPNALMSQVPKNAALRKPANPFEVEQEFRMLWYDTDFERHRRHETDDFLIVKCPEAAMLCREL